MVATYDNSSRSPIQRQHLPIDPLSFVARKEARDVGHVLWKAITMQWRCVGRHLQPFIRSILLAVRDIVLRNVVEHVRNSATRGDCVDGDLLISTVL